MSRMYDLVALEISPRTFEVLPKPSGTMLVYAPSSTKTGIQSARSVLQITGLSLMLFTVIVMFRVSVKPWLSVTTYSNSMVPNWSVRGVMDTVCPFWFQSTRTLLCAIVVPSVTVQSRLGSSSWTSSASSVNEIVYTLLSSSTEMSASSACISGHARLMSTLSSWLVAIETSSTVCQSYSQSACVLTITS